MPTRLWPDSSRVTRRPAGEVWIVDPDRGNRPAFNRQMADEGFLLREERLDTPAALGVAAYKGRLLVYQRAAH